MLIVSLFVFFLMRGRPPRSTLFPYPTLSRSLRDASAAARAGGRPRTACRARTQARIRPPVSEQDAGVHVVISPDRKSTRLNSSHANISYAVFCLKKKNKKLTSTIITLSHPRI